MVTELQMCKCLVRPSVSFCSVRNACDVHVFSSLLFPEVTPKLHERRTSQLGLACLVSVAQNHISLLFSL